MQMNGNDTGLLCQEESGDRPMTSCSIFFLLWIMLMSRWMSGWMPAAGGIMILFRIYEILGG